MTIVQSIYDTYKRYRTLQTDHIQALPVAILMPHSACNCRCVMCDIWKDNKNLKQLTEKDIEQLLVSFKKLGTQQVVMSGGEALLNPNFFLFCKILKKHEIKISLLSTGLTLQKHAENLIRYTDDIIVSLDGDESTHNYIRNIPDAFRKLSEGVREIKGKNQTFKITGRTVIHRINFRKWPAIIQSAKEMKLDQISFLPADVSSHAFNREILWNSRQQHEILLGKEELPELETIIDAIIKNNAADFTSGFIAETAIKLKKIYTYYSAFYGLNAFPYKKCNAPWVSAVVEADGKVRPCFFHHEIGNIRDQSFGKIINSEKAMRFRKNLDMQMNSTCVKCVCYLHLSPGTKLS